MALTIWTADTDRDLMRAAKRAVAGAGLRGCSSLAIRDARACLECWQPIAAARFVNVAIRFY